MLKQLVRGVFKGLGYEILGPPRAFEGHSTLMALLQREDVNLVVDVGANIGQFVHELRDAGYRGRVVSFEPQAAAHAALVAAAAKDANWTIAERTAVGAERGTLAMNKSENTVSSSLLAMLPAHTEAAPSSGYIGTETVDVNRLDDVCPLAASDRVLLKIDVQGYEKPVLDGAERALASCRAVLVEMSLIPLYEGQLVARQLWDALDTAGFDAWAFEPGFRSPQSGRMLQMDGLFVRRTPDK